MLEDKGPASPSPIRKTRKNIPENIINLNKWQHLTTINILTSLFLKSHNQELAYHATHIVLNAL